MTKKDATNDFEARVARIASIDVLNETATVIQQYEPAFSYNAVILASTMTCALPLLIYTANTVLLETPL